MRDSTAGLRRDPSAVSRRGHRRDGRSRNDAAALGPSTCLPARRPVMAGDGQRSLLSKTAGVPAASFDVQPKICWDVRSYVVWKLGSSSSLVDSINNNRPSSGCSSSFGAGKVIENSSLLVTAAARNRPQRTTASRQNTRQIMAETVFDYRERRLQDLGTTGYVSARAAKWESRGRMLRRQPASN